MNKAKPRVVLAEPAIKLKRGKFNHPSGRRNSLNDLTGSEWAQSSKSIESYPDTRSAKQRLHGAAFPQSLAEHQIMIYTKRNEMVLDPFVGVGTTLDACRALGRNGIGIELNPDFANLAKADVVNLNGGSHQEVICDDARRITKHIEPDSIDFVLTSPPYANMLRKVQRQFGYKWKPFGFVPVENGRPYSTDKRDIGNMHYDEALQSLKAVFEATFAVVREDHYAAWVVKDFRDLPAGIPYMNFHGEIIRIAGETGWTLWDIRIFDQTRYRPLVILGIPSRNFYLNLGHSYILIFKKQSTQRKNRRSKRD